MTISERIETALSLLYSCKWNLKKRENAFSLLRDIFDNNQLAIIRKAYLSGLPRSHLKRLIYPGFTWQQMMIIEGELHELPLDKVLHFANPSFTVPQMQIIAEGIRSGFSTDQINFLIQYKHSIMKMKIILGSFQHGVTEDDLMKIYREVKHPE